MTLPTGNKRSDRGGAGLAPGFTLVELLLVMTILVVVLGVAMPTLAHFFRGRTLDLEARRLLALTRLGQSRAISEGVPILLWLDVRRRAYGLEEEPSYTDLDPKAVELNLHEDVSVRVVNPTRVARPVANTAAAARAKLAQSRSPHRNLPAIRFQPDGSFSEDSLPALCLTGYDGATLWLTQSRSRLYYEIRSQNDPWDETIR